MATHAPAGVVPSEYSIVSLTCCIGCAPGAVMVGWPGVSADLVPADALAIWAGGAGVPRGRAKDAELLVVRHENGVLRRTAGRIGTSPATGPGSLRWPRSSRGGGGPGSSR